MWFGFALGLVWCGFGLGLVWFGLALGWVVFDLGWAASYATISLKIIALTSPLKSFTFPFNICNLLLLSCSCSFWCLVWVGFGFGLVWFELALSWVGPNPTQPARQPARLAGWLVGWLTGWVCLGLRRMSWFGTDLAQTKPKPTQTKPNPTQSKPKTKPNQTQNLPKPNQNFRTLKITL